MFFDVVAKQIVLLDTYQIITNLGKMVCLHCTIAVAHAHWTFLSYNLISKVVLFYSFLVITVVWLNRKIKGYRMTVFNNKLEEINCVGELRI